MNAQAATRPTADHALIAIPANGHIDVIRDRRTHDVAVPAQIVDDTENAPMPRATDKQMRDARKRADAASRVNTMTQAHIDADKTAPAAPAAPAPSPAAMLSEARRQEAPTSAPAIPTTGYQGPMLSLRDRLKAGAYTKMANGQPANGDDVATALGHLEPKEVIRACLIAMNLDGNPYLHLNIGQQSMNLRNKLRGMLKRGEFGMGVLNEAVEVVLEGRAVQAREQTPAAPAEPVPAPVQEEAPAPAETAPAPAEPTKRQLAAQKAAATRAANKAKAVK